MAGEHKDTLLDLFPNLTEAQIDEAIAIVLEQQCSLSSEERLEEMINLLVESGDSTLAGNINHEDGATGVSSTPNHKNHQRQYEHHYNQLMNYFPDICPKFLADFCNQYDEFDLEQVLEDLSGTNYVKIERDPLDVWEHLKQMLPNADPIYLRNQARVLVNRPAGELEQFIAQAVEKQDYPTMQEYLKNKEMESNLDLYINRFSVDVYLDKVPNPIDTFGDPNRKPILSKDSDENDLSFALNFLCNQFLYLRKNEISKIFLHFNRDLIKTCNKLKTLPKAFRHPKEPVELGECKNVELLKEVSFIKHERAIRQFLKQKDEKYRLALEEAIAQGLLQTCGCCYDDQLIPEECYFCNRGCIFCKECVKQGAETVIGKEETVFPCLAECDSEFDYSTLKMVLDDKVFQGIWHRRQIEEVRNANIDGLEQCPHCDFCMVPNEGDKIFKCANINCMAETCRLCRHPSHVPLRCNEIEYDEDVKRRTYIENKMTESLLRKCWKCNKQFYKESGCNKMTCFCGAKMCYVCGAAVTDYTHFNGSQSKCPLYTENLAQFHQNRVLQGAQLAKEELGITQNPDLLKFDPTRGVERDVM